MSSSEITVELRVTVNGQPQVRNVEPRLLLVHFLRDELGLTGTHVGCDTSQCGACTILLNGDAVKACNMFAVQAAAGHITTIEGISSADGPHPIQQAFAENHALQCGFCTPGFVMCGVQLLARYPDPTEDQIRHQLDGNICRCTGYRGIVRAIMEAARVMRQSPAVEPVAGGPGN
jgi:carbon-monoxide dehydrogenase small subunit